MSQLPHRCLSILVPCRTRYNIGSTRNRERRRKSLTCDVCDTISSLRRHIQACTIHCLCAASIAQIEMCWRKGKGNTQQLNEWQFDVRIPSVLHYFVSLPRVQAECISSLAEKIYVCMLYVCYTSGRIYAVQRTVTLEQVCCVLSIARHHALPPRWPLARFLL